MSIPLNAEDQAVLDSLVSPSQSTPARYPWSEDFQRMTLGAMLCNRFFMVQGMGVIQPEYFVHELHQLACRLLVDYFTQHRQLPSRIFMKEMVLSALRKRHQDPDTEAAIRLIYLTELNLIYDYYTAGGVGDLMPGLDAPEAILEKITSFAKSQAVKGALLKGLKLIQEKPESEDIWLQMDEWYKEARLVDRHVDIGLDYFQTLQERYERMAKAEAEEDVFTSGFQNIDNGLQGGGLKRGEIGAWMASPGTGKSLALVVASVKNLQKGHKVLYITTEMDADRVAARFDSQLSLIGQHELLPKKEEVWRMLQQEVMAHEDKRRLMVKQFASGTADMNTLRSYHSQLVMLGFKPDLVIVDYPGDMKEQPGISQWDSRFRLLRDIRGFGVDEGHCTLIAIQPNRTAATLGLEEFLDQENQGDSFNQARVLDAFWTLNQTRQEKKACVGRAFVAKTRNGLTKYNFKVHFDYKKQTLAIREITLQKYKHLMSLVTDEAEEATQIDSINLKNSGVDWEQDEPES